MALQNAGPEASSSLDGFSSPEREEADSLFGSELDDNVDTEVIPMFILFS